MPKPPDFRSGTLTPIPYRSFWGATRQKDGTIVSQIRAEFLAKNRTGKILHLLAARVVRPKIPGELLQAFITTPVDDAFGIDCVPPGATLHVTVNMLIRGYPGRVRKNPTELAAVLALKDDEGNEQRIKLALKAIPAPLEDAKQ
jgi:hypothetical protein